MPHFQNVLLNKHHLCHAGLLSASPRAQTFGCKHLLEVTGTCKDRSPSGRERQECTHGPEVIPAPVLRTSPCKQSARKASVINGQTTLNLP